MCILMVKKSQFKDLFQNNINIYYGREKQWVWNDEQEKVWIE